MKNLQISDTFIKVFNKFNEIKNNTVIVGVSGGIDSMCLLLTLNEWSKKNNTKVIAITVDHKLRLTSTEEANYVSQICHEFDIEHHILTWDAEKSFKNLEAKARDKRYELISKFCKENSVKYLITAHHMSDQAETFFIRLFRGSGIEGLSSMQEITNIFDITIIRPFLTLHKSFLKKFLIDNSIKWIEDESNQDEKFLRNKIRNFIDSFEDKETITERINFAINEINKCKENFLKIVNEAEKDILKFEFDRCILFIDNIFKYDSNVILRLLAKALMNESGNIYKPRLEKLKKLFDEIVKFYFDRTLNLKYTFYGCVIEKVDDKMVVVYREYNSITDDVYLEYKKEIIWDNRFKIILKDNSIKDIKITHLQQGEFNSFLEYLRLTNFKIFKEIKKLKNIDKKIFYTIPLVKTDKYLINYNYIDIKRILIN